MNATRSTAAPRLGIAAALAAVYLLWGSTYLAIRFAIETMPPLLMAGTRFLIAGTILYAWMRLRGTPRAEPRQWGAAAIVGALLLLGGNGAVTLAERWVPSGIAALMIATVPLWMVLLDWLRRGGVRPKAGAIAGLVLGFIGVAILIGPASAQQGGLHRIGAALLLFAALSWSFGSIYSRTAPLPKSPLMATAMEMLCGGALLLIVGLAMGEAGQVDPAAFSGRSVLALAHLILFGSLVAFSCYIWLLRVVSAATASTYAFVNPVVAVVLGWALASEVLEARAWIACVIIVGAVVLITTSRTSPAAAAAESRPPRGPGPWKPCPPDPDAAHGP